MGWYMDAYKKNPIMTGVLTLAAGVGAYWVGKKLFLKPEPPPLPHYDLPEGGGGIPQIDTIVDPKTGTVKAVLWSPKPLANELFESMEGFDWTSTKERAWYKLSALPTNDMVVAVYNYFNSMPAVVSAKVGTLPQWIRDESGAWDDSYKEAALQRLSALNLA